MKYLIQIFRSEPESNVGRWENTAWGSDDLDKTKATAADILANNRMNIIKVRVLGLIQEIGKEACVA